MRPSSLFPYPPVPDIALPAGTRVIAPFLVGKTDTKFCGHIVARRRGRCANLDKPPESGGNVMFWESNLTFTRDAAGLYFVKIENGDALTTAHESELEVLGVTP